MGKTYYSALQRMMRAKARTGGNQPGLICVTGLPDRRAPRMMRIKRGKKERRKNAEPRHDHFVR
jgi:hypothetical protein